jgi:hypothetical protein
MISQLARDLTTNRFPFLKSSSDFLILHLINIKCLPLNILLGIVFPSKIARDKES